MVKVEWRQMCAAGEVMLVRLFAVEVKDVERKGKVEVNAAFDAGRCEGGALRGGAFFVAHARVAVAERPQQPFGIASAGSMAQASNLLLPLCSILQKKYDTKVYYTK